MSLPQPAPTILRIIDANANRAAEGLRVVEEYLRFDLEDAHLTELCKQLRHDLGMVLASCPMTELLAARNTLADVGTTLQTSDEYQRLASYEVAVASQKRVEQSLRCLEEYAKTFSPELAAKLETLRYRCYTLAKAVSSTTENLQRLAAARLYVLIDGANSEEQFAGRVEALITAGVHVLQLRDKSLGDRDLLCRARKLRELTRNSSTLFIVNDRADIAALADADGVHVGQEELSVADARRILGSRRFVGVSTHSREQARRAVLDGADYIGCGPTFPSETKAFAMFPGLELLRQVAAEIRLPAFAIGGITSQNLESVLATGIGRIAVSSAISRSSDVHNLVTELLARL